VAGQLAFVVAWAVAGALQTGYAPADQAVSDLAALTADNRWIVGLGLVCLAMSDTAQATTKASWPATAIAARGLPRTRGSMSHRR